MRRYHAERRLLKMVWRVRRALSGGGCMQTVVEDLMRAVDGCRWTV